MAFPSLYMNKIAVCLLFLLGSSNAQLSTDFYLQSCPDLYSTVSTIVQQYIAEERRTGASLLRLHFHDCFVNGCDGSILLDDTEGFVGEKNAAPNVNSARGFGVVDDIKNSLERVCPGVVSCADILALAARDSVETLGGPTWDVKLGRRDARTASQAAANNSIPPPTSNLDSLISSFQAQGLSVRDMVALSGSHTIGLARCTNFRARIFNDTNIDGNFAEISRRSCPCTGGSGDDNLGPLDIETSTAFDNNYYGNLIGQRGLLHSDQELFNGGSPDALVRFYNDNSSAFYADFAAAMIKMGDIRPLTGSSGEIRRNCRWPN